MIGILNHFGRVWFEFFAFAAVQNTIFLLIVFAALYMARHASAQVRYAISLVGILKLLLPPFLPAFFLFPPAATMTAVAGPSAPFLAGDAPGPASNPFSGLAAPEPAGFIFLIWAAVAAGLILASIVSTLRLSLSLRSAVPVAHIGATRSGLSSVGIYKSKQISMPITVGVFPRRIYVPESWDNWSPDCQQAVIRHEMAHITRLDGFAQVFQILAQSIYFFHPLVWVLNRRLSQYREMACDDSSVGAGCHSRLEYSRRLVEIAETAARDPFAYESVSALLGRKNELLNRIRYQMKEGIMHGTSRTRVALTVAALLLAILPLSWYQSTATPDKTTAGPGRTTAAQQSGRSAPTKTFVDVSVESADLILVDGKKTNLESFGKGLTKTTAGKDGVVIVNLSCAADLPMGVLFKVQKKMVETGHNKVNYQNDVAGAMPLVLPGTDVEERLRSIPDEDIAVVHVEESGDVEFNDSKVPLESIHEHVKKAVQANDMLIVRLKIDHGATYTHFTRVLHEVKTGGATRIVIN